MFHFIIQKMKNKGWMTICQVMGMAFLVASLSCLPMFQAGASDKLLRTTFEKYIEENNQYPTVIGRSGVCDTEKTSEAEQVIRQIQEYENTWKRYLSDLTPLTTQTRLTLGEEKCRGTYDSKNSYLSISYIPDMMEHSQIVYGEGFDMENADGDCYPCIISEGVMDSYQLVVGETISLGLEDEDAKQIQLVVAGIFKEKENKDLFWYVEPNEFEKEIFVSEEHFNDIVKRYDKASITYHHFMLLDYRDINHRNVDDVMYYLEQFHLKDANLEETIYRFYAPYLEGKKTIEITLWVLELPLLGMVLAFIYMVSGQLVRAELNEIAMLKSRGIKRKQVIFLYLLQAGITSVLALAVGFPFGWLLCKIGGGTVAFLKVSTGSMHLYHPVWQMLPYGLLAVIVGSIFLLIPVIQNSHVSIVERIGGDNRNQKMLWEKYYLDVLLFLGSIYLFYNFNKQQDSIRLHALAGNTMDPFIFLDTILFIVGFGLITLRLIHCLVRRVYALGKKKWNPVMYASFLQITRSFSKQGFISVFMILTVALGIFYANTARTINQNNINRVEYDNGADVVIEEYWKKKIYENNQGVKDFIYLEPDYGKYEMLVQEGLLSNVTRVISDPYALAIAGSTQMENCLMLGIHTKNLGETSDLNVTMMEDVHWYEHLNALAKEPYGLIISKNLAEEMDLAVGDSLGVQRESHEAISKIFGRMNGTVVAIVDGWPGFSQYYMVEGEQKERYLIIGNYATMVQTYKVTPYSIWGRLAKGVTSDDVYQALLDQHVEIDSFASMADDIEEKMQSALVQITNGMFTLSFVIALLLCGVGFLIYWVSSIRQRELLFGVYRAMGLSVNHINRMLVNEHIFSTLLSIVAGCIVGMVATFLFTKLFCLIYLPEKHNLPLSIFFEGMDIAKLLLIVLAMIVVCALVLRKLVITLNITQALKMGEE